MTEIPHVMTIDDFNNHFCPQIRVPSYSRLDSILGNSIQRKWSETYFDGSVVDARYGGYSESDKQLAERIKAQEEKK